ncbi:MAG: hypothetical protein IKS92_09375 [Victivallales bacterium]|nr:hypothetical protein [Victivallales bacterium]
MSEERMDELKKRTPMDLSFKQLWKRRFVFDAELPFPKDVTFLPCGHYAAEVTSLPAEMPETPLNRRSSGWRTIRT